MSSGRGSDLFVTLLKDLGGIVLSRHPEAASGAAITLDSILTPEQLRPLELVEPIHP